MEKKIISPIAPCGMNCHLCYAFQREKNKCLGCNGPDDHKPKYCIQCRIKNCDKLSHIPLPYCCLCNGFPCTRLKQLDKRYKTRYGMSMIENLKTLESIGIEAFMEKEMERWTCLHCGTLICVHKKNCHGCGEPVPNYTKKNKGET